MPLVNDLAYSNIVLKNKSDFIASENIQLFPRKFTTLIWEQKMSEYNPLPLAP